MILVAAVLVADAARARPPPTVLGRDGPGHGHAVAVRPSQLRHVVLLLPFHTAVLEPDLDLSLGERQGVSDLDASTAREVAVEVELFLQFQRLVASVRLTRSLLLEAEIYTASTSSISSVNQRGRLDGVFRVPTFLFNSSNN